MEGCQEEFEDTKGVIRICKSRDMSTCTLLFLC